MNPSNDRVINVIALVLGVTMFMFGNVLDLRARPPPLHREILRCELSRACVSSIDGC